MKKMLALVMLSLALACAKTPPNLTPEASAAFKATQAVKALDLLRDAAVTANAERPSLLDDATTRKVVLYHQSTVKVVQAAPQGWKPAALAGLDELTKNLSDKDKKLIGPYATLVRTIVQEVTR